MTTPKMYSLYWVITGYMNSLVGAGMKKPWKTYILPTTRIHNIQAIRALNNSKER